MFDLHGSFEIERRDDIVFIDMSGPWNIETALAFKLALEETIQTMGLKQWAAYTRMSDWELCTPDCEPVIVEFSLYAKRNGLAREAIMNEKGVTKLELFEKYRNDALVKEANPKFARGFFKDADSALAWLHAQGFGNS